MRCGSLEMGRKGLLPLALLGIVLAQGPARQAAAQDCEYPGVLLIVDRSSSMTGTIQGGSKWEIARDAVTTMVDTYQDEMRFGLMIYPGPHGLGADGVEGAVGACALAPTPCTAERPKCSTGEVVAQIGADAPAVIAQQMAFDPPAGGAYTPTWQSLEAADRYAPLHNAGRRNFAVLITDGWQCCGVNDSNQCANSATERFIAVDKVTQLRQHGVTVFVIGFGGSVDTEMLNRAANAAGTARAGCAGTAASPCYYQANDHAQLAGFLDTIGRQISAEVCDGRDNDCDNVVDGLTRGCESSCGGGTEICEAGRWGQCDAPVASAEVCDGVDNDCDGQTDEELRQACNTECGRGEERCADGRWVDCTAAQPGIEICNGTDDDCDSVTDEDCECAEGSTEQCGSDTGECSPGTRTCSGGHWSECGGGAQPRAELCDGLDNDCDGTVDSFEQNCATACGAGTQVCLNGEWRACNAPLPSRELCDNLDNDCDGQTDEELTRTCNNGCGDEDGIETCTAGAWADCSARAPAETEACGDGIDGNCDGETDEGCECEEGETLPCGSNRGECEEGVKTCESGHYSICRGGRQPGVETCDSLDNDCDGQTDETTEESCSNDCGEGTRECVAGELGQCSIPEPPAEVCDGLDNDCDGQQDEGDLCTFDPERDRCFCGGCTGRCIQNECTGGAKCVDGYCILDHCPTGMHCVGTLCVPGGEGEGEGGEGEGEASDVPGEDTDKEGDGTLLSGGPASEDCGCATARTGEAMTQSLPLWLGLLGLLAIRRRRG